METTYSKVWFLKCLSTKSSKSEFSKIIIILNDKFLVSWFEAENFPEELLFNLEQRIFDKEREFLQIILIVIFKNKIWRKNPCFESKLVTISNFPVPNYYK